MAKHILVYIVPDTQKTGGWIAAPVFAEDNEYMRKLPHDAAVVATFRHSRQARTNAHRWALMQWVLSNLPEKFERDLGGKTVEYFDDWMKLKTGYCDVVTVDGVEHKKPRSASFDNCPNEAEYLAEYHEPALGVLAWMMGYATVQELIEASKQYGA